MIMEKEKVNYQEVYDFSTSNVVRLGLFASPVRIME